MSDLDKLSQDLLGKSLTELDADEAKVLQHIQDRSVVQLSAAEIADLTATPGEKLADKVAAVGGSWGFIISFGVILFGWMILNSSLLKSLGITFDPYPYIFLNLMLSTLAAVQAPLIMMSQNRQAKKDRIAAENDYRVNLRAELEIIDLHRKIDRVLAKLDS